MDNTPLSASQALLTPPATSEPSTPMHDMGGGFSPEQVKQSYDWLVQDGKMSQSQADSEMQAKGVHVDQTNTQPVKSGSEFFALDSVKPPAGSLTSEQETVANQQDVLIRESLAKGHFDNQGAKAFLRTVLDQQRLTSKMNPEQVSSWAHNEKHKFEQVHGKEAAQSKISKIKSYLSDLDERSPGIGDLLRASNGPWSALSLSVLDGHIAHLESSGKKYWKD